ncbi:unnamed protein product [Rodentolepis nana]|uniref:Gamma-secretase-activating protein C-terminal domain-containing protein n=1 Tax=Rodentolepis nana TaxID=102285 RepID=A0A0R3T3X4_RODNA|nr:unnamed protein product [Rodentolepis nana]
MMSLGLDQCNRSEVSTNHSECGVANYINEIANKKYHTYYDLEKDLYSENLSVFSFVFTDKSTKNTGLAIKWIPLPSSLSFILIDYNTVLFLEDKSFLQFLTNCPMEKCPPFPTVFLVFKSIPNKSYNFHILYFEPGCNSVICLKEFELCVNGLRLPQLLRDISESISSDRGQRNANLSASFFTHKNSVFANTFYFSLAIKFLHPYFDEFCSQFLDMKIELPLNYLWEDIVPFIFDKFQSIPDYGLKCVRSICEKNGHFAQINNKYYFMKVMESFLSTHHLWSQQNSKLSLVNSILEHLIFPYLPYTSSLADIFQIECCVDVKYSKVILNALAEFQPQLLRVLMESNMQVLWILGHLLHLQSLCGDLGMCDKWMKQSFSLYCHCLDQLGHSGTVLPSQIFYSGGRIRDLDFYVERYERSFSSSNVPRLFSLAIKAARFHIRQVILSKPLPRPSFSSQLDSISILSPNLKKFVQIKRFE